MARAAGMVLGGNQPHHALASIYMNHLCCNVSCDTARTAVTTELDSSERNIIHYIMLTPEINGMGWTYG